MRRRTHTTARVACLTNIWWPLSLLCFIASLAIPDADRAIAQSSKATKSQGTESPAKNTANKKEPNDIGRKELDLGNEDKDFQTFLDRLMLAESGGNNHAKNPRSSALGPYQFINSTFLTVTKRYFADDVAGKTSAQILALRTDRKFARKAAAAYSKENAAILEAEDIPPTFGNLRLAFLLGPGGAIRLLKAKPSARLSRLLSRSVIRANPFMARLTAADLIERSINEISIDPARKLSTTGFKKPKSKKPRIKVRCNLGRPSCRRWLALKKRKLRIKERAKAKKKAKTTE